MHRTSNTQKPTRTTHPSQYSPWAAHIEQQRAKNSVPQLDSAELQRLAARVITAAVHALGRWPAGVVVV